MSSLGGSDSFVEHRERGDWKKTRELPNMFFLRSARGASREIVDLVTEMPPSKAIYHPIASAQIKMHIYVYETWDTLFQIVGPSR